MAELIGTTSRIHLAGILPFPLRQQVLIFDRLATLNPRWPEASLARARDLELLTSRGILISPDELAGRLHEFTSGTLSGMFDAVIRRAFTGASVDSDEEALPLAGEIVARLLAAGLRSTQSLNAVPILSGWHTPPEEAATREEVVQLVVRAIPTPSEDHDLKDILNSATNFNPATSQVASECG